MIVAGFGFRASATVESLVSALDRAGGGRQIDLLATPVDKSRSDIFLRLAKEINVKPHPVHEETLAAQKTLTHSSKVAETRPTGSVAEAAALAAAGPGATLLGPRAVSEDRLATCALAESAP
ncbi:MAG: cobalamin biosynthesis protein [Pseudooceanicola nanhaiensis]